MFWKRFCCVVALRVFLEGSACLANDIQDGRRPLAAEHGVAIDRAVSENERDWREVPLAKPVTEVRLWRRRETQSEKADYLPKEDVSLLIMAFSQVEEAKSEMVRRHQSVARRPLGTLKSVGDEAEAWGGFAVPGLTAIHCRSGRFVFSIMAPSKEIGEQFARDVAKALAASSEGPTRSGLSQ